MFMVALGCSFMDLMVISLGSCSIFRLSSFALIFIFSRIFIISSLTGVLRVALRLYMARLGVSFCLVNDYFAVFCYLYFYANKVVVSLLTFSF